MAYASELSVQGLFKLDNELRHTCTYKTPLGIGVRAIAKF